MITKRELKVFRSEAIEAIEALRQESIEHPVTSRVNNERVLKLEGKIEFINYLLTQ